MNGTVLITDIDSTLGLEAAKAFLQKGYNVVGTSKEKIDASSLPLSGEAGNKFIPLRWTKNSPISARNLVIQAQNRFEKIDIALIVQNLPREEKLFNEVEFNRIESQIDNNMIGPLFLAREILKHFHQRIHNNPETVKVLSFVLYSESPLNYSTPIEAILKSGIEGFVKSYSHINERKDIVTVSFFTRINRIESPNEYIEYISSSLMEKPKKNNGKTFNYSGKKGLFG